MVLSEGGLLARMTAPASELAPLPAGVRVTELSSHDQTGGNIDGGSYDQSLNPALPVTFVRTEDGGYVLADEHGPGCLVRVWMTASTNQVQGDPSSFGNIQMFFDSASKPAIDEPADQFFSGADPRFPAPLVNDYHHSSGGNYSYVPLCFAHRFVLRVTGALSTSSNYFQLTFLRAPAGTATTTYDGGGTDLVKAAAARVNVAPVPPTAGRTVQASSVLSPGASLSLAPLAGPGTIRYLQVSVKPFDIATLDALSLRITVDGANSPQVDVPLADAFGDGLEVRPVSARVFGMDPSSSTGYFALPIPFRSRAKVAIASTSATAAVTMRAWIGGPLPTSAHLVGQQLITQTKFGQDFPVLREAGGSGHLAAYVMDLEDSGTALSSTNGGQWFMEGDDEVYVDGLRSPSIYGTGTEDEFNGGYYFNQGPFTLPFSGAGPLDKTGSFEGGAQSAYRVYTVDGVDWSNGIDFSQQWGGDNERLTSGVAKATTFSYQAASALTVSDHVAFSDTASEHAHRLSGSSTPVALDAYFEGAHDGTIPASTLVFGGTFYVSSPPQASNQSLSASGIEFTRPVSVTLRIGKANRGVVLRRLQDQDTPAPVTVTVDGRAAGVWPGAAFQGNPSKRWLETDYWLAPRLTAGRSTIRVTLAPADPGETATAYSLESLTSG